MFTSPFMMGSIPARILSRVDFPAPEGPTRVTKAPGGKDREISSNTAIGSLPRLPGESKD